MAWSDLRAPGVSYAASPWDSRRFGTSVGRVSVGHGTTWSPELVDQVRQALSGDDEVLVVRHPPELTGLSEVLAASSRRLLPADALVYWETTAAALAGSAPATPGLIVTRGSGSPADLDEAVRATFADYPNHYAVNPLFPPDDVLAGYVEWALRAAGGGHVAVLRDDEGVVGFATWSADEELDHVEIELAGLVPRARGRGVYGQLLAEVGRVAVEAAIAKVVISTQAGNVRVQRAWHRAGLAPMAVFTTLHAVRAMRRNAADLER